MPTVRQNVVYLREGILSDHRAAFRRLVRSIIILIVIALCLEIFVFNFNYYASAGYSPINLKSRIDLRQNDDHYFQLTAVDHVIEFSNLNTEVHNIRLEFDQDQPAQNLPVTIQFTDEAHVNYFGTTDYTVGVPVVDVSTKSTQSEFINLNAAGRMGSLRIEISGDNVEYPISLKTIILNAHHPFDFNVVRFGWTLGILLLIFMFRPKSAIYRINIVENPLESKAGIITAVCIEVLLVSTFLFYGSNLVGVATSSYNYGAWDGHSLVNTFQVGGDNSQQYAELAKALAHGQVYLDEEPPQWLKDMSDPYDSGARAEAQKESGEPYLFDVAYFNGRYYVYFGVVPVLLFYLPFYLLTGGDFPTAIGVLIMAIAFILGCSMLLDRFARYHFKQVSLGLYLLLQIPLIACCGILYLVKFPTFYSLPIMCALTFSVWGLYFWMRGRLSGVAGRWYFIGSLCMALVAGCRPQFLVLSLLAFPLFWRTFITERRLLTARGAREFACLVAPYILVAIGIMSYNYARFGSVVDFGSNYNLTVNDMTRRGMNVGRLAPAFFSYFLQPPSVVGVFPFIEPAPFDTTYMGQTIKEVTFGGILACLPVLWILPFARRILVMRSRQRNTHTIFGVIVILIVTGVLVALLDAEMAGILQRYYADFSFMFLAAVVLLIFVVNENLKPRSTSKDLLLKVVIVLVGLSTLYSILLCFVPEIHWYSDVYPWAYQDIIEMVQFWT